MFQMITSLWAAFDDVMIVSSGFVIHMDKIMCIESLGAKLIGVLATVDEGAAMAFPNNILKIISCIL